MSITKLGWISMSSTLPIFHPNNHDNMENDKNKYYLGIIPNDNIPDIGDYEAEFPQPIRRSKPALPPIKDTKLDINKSTDPLIQKMVRKMIFERFMEDEPDINIRFEAYKRKMFG